MDNIQFYTILASILGSFAWMISRMDKLSDRLTEVEKDVSMIKCMLMPIKPRTEP